jgi:hypothetical protein
MKTNNNFAIFILSHGRPNNVITYDTLIKCGYTGKVYIIIDNEDIMVNGYKKNFKDKVIIFDKLKVSKKFDEADNFNDRRCVVYARNACFDIAKKLGIKYFMQLDDDYNDFRFKTNSKFNKIHRKQIKNLDIIIGFLLKYYKSIPAKSIAIAQGGDFIGGHGSDIDSSINRRRKCMNTFICSTDRPFKFYGRINEDVNTYTWFQSLGNLFLTFPLVAIQQLQTQDNTGGMTDIYMKSGTYIKSFYTIIFQPSSVIIEKMHTFYPRLHHRVNWDRTVPKIISEKYKK